MTGRSAATPEEILHRIAMAMSAGSGSAPVRVGGFVLRPAQTRTLAAMLASLRAFGGVLVADPPGTGKTVLALAAVRALGDAPALVVAPAALRAQWETAAERAGVTIAFASVESLSRGAVPRPATIVVVDEAHQARTPGTRRYERLAARCLGARVILLTATPVVNRGGDRGALLALFLGARSARLTPAQVARCVLRTTEPSLRPAVRELGAIGRGVDIPGLGDAIAALPPPLPIEAASPARALVVMTLAMAWRSSLAALDAALRRRVQRGEALRDLLRAGARPSRAMLRHWVLHDDGTQLAMAGLFAEPDPTAAAARPDALGTLERHLDAVRALRERIGPHRADDAKSRADAIRALASRHPERRIVVFARQTRTILALHAALRGDPGVVAIVGARVLAAAGRWSRDELLRAVGPRARPLRADDPKAIRILLATDVVAEGVEMQGVGVVVHADLPWTPARLEQRLGRVTRVGSAAREVLVGRFAAPRGAKALIRLGERLQRKADARRASTHAARARAEIATILERWRVGRGPTPVGAKATGVATAPARATPPTIATLPGTGRDRFLALIEPERSGDGAPWLLVGERSGDRWRVSATPQRVRRVLRAVDHAFDRALDATRGEAARTGRLGQDDPESLDRLARSIAHHLGRRSAHELIADPGDGCRRTAEVRRRLARLLERAPALARGPLAAQHAASIATLAGPMELARERRLDALLRADADDATFARRLGALLAPRPLVNDESRPGSPGRLSALLVLRAPIVRAAADAPSRASAPRPAPAPARPSASPGTAAPR